MGGENRTGWFDGLQALRALLFLLVFVSHSGDFLRGVDGAWGGIAVAVFFVLSGFLCGCREPSADGVWWKDCILGVWKKLRKFWVLHFIVLLVAAWYMPGRFKDFIRCALLVQSFCGKAKVALSFNWPTWFLSSLMFCYLLAPLLNRAATRIARHAAFALPAVWAVQAAWAAVWIGSPEAYGPGYYWVYICPFARVFDFLSGVLVAKLFRRYGTGGASGAICTLTESAIIAVFAALLWKHDFVPMIFRYCVIWMPISAALIWAFAAGRGRVVKALCNPPLMWLGLRSFELYILHRVVLKAFADAGATAWYWWTLAFVLTCLAAEAAARTIRRIGRA